MLNTTSMISDLCMHSWEEVSYNETANDVRHVSYVMMNGQRVMGLIRTCVCSKCMLVQEYITSP